MATACQTNAACLENSQGLIVVENADALRNARVDGGCADEAIMMGLVTPGDGSGGLLYFDPLDVQPDDGVTIFTSVFGGNWIRSI